VVGGGLCGGFGAGGLGGVCGLLLGGEEGVRGAVQVAERNAALEPASLASAVRGISWS
jgi:hypothetical protein